MIQYDGQVDFIKPANKGVLRMDRVSGRKSSIEANTESHDTLKAVESYQQNVYPVIKPFVDLTKCKKRKFEDLVSGTDCYANIKRDNERAATLKKLLNPE